MKTKKKTTPSCFGNFNNCMNVCERYKFCREASIDFDNHLDRVC